MGPFIVDFYCHEARLVVELDGEIHAEEDQAALDAARSAWLAESGYRADERHRNGARTDSEGASPLPLTGLDPHPYPSPADRG